MTGAYMHRRIPALDLSLGTLRCAIIIILDTKSEADVEGSADRSFVVHEGCSVPPHSWDRSLTLGRRPAMAHASYLTAPSRGSISYRRPTTYRSLVRGSLSLVALCLSYALYRLWSRLRRLNQDKYSCWRCGWGTGSSRSRRER